MFRSPLKSKQTHICNVIHRLLIPESVMASEDEKDCESSNNEELTRMSKFVRFLVRIYFLPLKLGEDKTTFSLCSLPSLLNFLFYYVSSVSLSFLPGVLYFSEEKRQATMKSSGFVDILSGLSFHTTILLLFPSVPLLFGQVWLLNSFSRQCIKSGHKFKMWTSYCGGCQEQQFKQNLC